MKNYNKAAFVLRYPPKTPARVIVAEARKAGLSFTDHYVYKTRARAKENPKTGTRRVAPTWKDLDASRVIPAAATFARFLNDAMARTMSVRSTIATLVRLHGAAAVADALSEVLIAGEPSSRPIVWGYVNGAGANAAEGE